MLYKSKSLLVTLIAAAFTGVCYGQLSVTNTTPYNSPGYLIQNVFMGGTITSNNFSFNGSTATTTSSNQVGYFTGGGSIFGIDSGIVMSSGNIYSLPQNTFASTSYGGAGDSDVLQVAQSVGWGTPPSIMRDRAVIEFDFVAPASDSIAFEYCFGSEEWPVYPCSQYNDAFGFFISGPGINGSYSNNAENVSIVPGTASLPVAITSIHNGTGSSPCNGNPSYAQYYNNGPTTQAFAFSDLNANNTYGAFTDVFQTAPLWVNACDTYHVKLAICDGVDWIFDSAVFLKAKSFDFIGITVSPTPSYNPWGFDTALYEGCGDLDLFFSRVDSVYNQYTMTYSIYGTATMGQDYGQVPGCTYTGTTQGVNQYDCSITFPQDSASVSINIPIYHDNATEIYESFTFIVTDTNVTNCVGGDTLNLSIIDQPVLQTSAFGNTTLDCNDSAAFIGVNITSGLPPYTFTWSNSVTDSTQYVQPSTTSSYVVQIEDGCGYQTATELVTVSVFNIPWSVVKIGDKQTVSCVDSPVDIGVGVQFNDAIWHGDISYQWSTGSTDSMISVFSTVDTGYSVTITRGCTGETVTKSFKLFTENDPVITSTVDIPETVMDCPGDPVNIKVSTTGGYPPYNFSWENGGTDSATVVGPYRTDTFHVTVTDDCGLVDYTDEVIVHVPVAEPLEILGVINDTVPCAELKVHFGPAVAKGGFGWGYELSWDDFQSPDITTQSVIYNDTPFTIKLTDGCRVDTAELTVWGIISDKNNLDLVLTQDTTICNGQSLALKAQGIDGGGKYQYYWQGASSPSDQYLLVNPAQRTTYAVRVIDQCDTVRSGKVTVDVSDVQSDFEYEYINDYDVQLHNHAWSSDSIKWYQWAVEGTSLISNEESPLLPYPNGDSYVTRLTVMNEHGCEDVAEMIVKPEYHLYIPTGFTPNKDGNNDVWSIESLGIRELKLEVYSRWGEKVFSTQDKDFEWDGWSDGERLPMGSYVWRIALWTDLDEYVEREGVVNIMNDFQSR